MKRKLTALFMAVAMLTAMTGCGGAGNDAPTTDEKVFRVGMEGTYAPYTYHDSDGKLTGYEVDVATAIAEKLGYRVEFVETEWDSMFEALAAGNFDVVMNQVTQTPERLEKYIYSISYIYSKPALIVTAENSEITSFDDVSGKKAAEGLTSNFNAIAKDYGAEIIGQDEFALAMECVLSGEADCTINDELTYAYWTQVKGDTESTKIVATLDEPTQSGVLALPEKQELIDEINKAIEELLADGTISKISEKYFAIDISQN